jgi:hypothetical protein
MLFLEEPVKISAILLLVFVAGCASASAAYNNEVVLTAATNEEVSLAKAGTISASTHADLNAAEHAAASAIAAEKTAAANKSWTGFEAASAADSALQSFLNALTTAKGATP